MSSTEKTRYHILKAYEDRGLEYALEFCDDLLESLDVKKLSAGFSQVSGVAGKLCECVLEIMLKDYIKKNNLKDWFYVTSLYLKDVVTKSDKYITEVDVVLFTPQVMFLVECKSYKGFKYLEGKGNLVQPKWQNSFDVYSQHQKHLEVFVSIFDPFKKDPTKRNGYQLGLFDYSIGSLSDRREDVWKKILPVLNKDNLYTTLDSFRLRAPAWDIRSVKKVVDLLEQNKSVRAAKHLDYVTSLHGKGKSNTNIN